jgi:hypothetical protein
MLMPPNLPVTWVQINLRIKLAAPQVKWRSLGSLQDLLANLRVQSHLFVALKRVVNKYQYQIEISKDEANISWFSCSTNTLTGGRSKSEVSLF